MKRLLFALMVTGLFPSAPGAACPDRVYDRDSGRYLYKTDAKERCEEAVNEAVNEAVAKAVDKACSEGYRKCLGKCTENSCEEACREGKRWCENTK